MNSNIVTLENFEISEFDQELKNNTNCFLIKEFIPFYKVYGDKGFDNYNAIMQYISEAGFMVNCVVPMVLKDISKFQHLNDKELSEIYCNMFVVYGVDFRGMTPIQRYQYE